MSNDELVVCDHCSGKGVACLVQCPCCKGEGQVGQGEYVAHMQRTMLRLIRLGRNMLEANQAKSNTPPVGTYQKGKEVPLPVTS